MSTQDAARAVVIVTGAGKGIGAASARWLAREGWRVVAADKDGAAAARVAAEIHGLAAKADVGVEADVADLVATTLDGYGRLDAIVSNAGISRFASLQDMSLDAWNTVIATNLTAAFLLAKYAENALRAAKGVMVLVSSTRAHMSERDTHAYSASKGGLVALTHALAISLGPDVRINCISPGWIDTKGEKLTAADHEQHPAGRVGRPDDIAAAVAWLLSEQTGFITGAEFIIDGGMTRKMIYV